MSKWIEFVALPKKSTDRKTEAWRVDAKANGYPLGEIRWFGNWRKYAFFPGVSTVFEQDCLRDIADFIELRTKLYIQEQKLNKKRL